MDVLAAPLQERCFCEDQGSNRAQPLPCLGFANPSSRQDYEGISVGWAPIGFAGRRLLLVRVGPYWFLVVILLFSRIFGMSLVVLR